MIARLPKQDILIVFPLQARQEAEILLKEAKSDEG